MLNAQCSLGNLYTFQFAYFLKTNQSLQNFNSPYPPTCINMCYSRSQYFSGFFFFHLLDRNECEDGSASCPANSDCFNTDGSYSCRCTEGYQLNEAGNCIGLYPRIFFGWNSTVSELALLLPVLLGRSTDAR